MIRSDNALKRYIYYKNYHDIDMYPNSLEILFYISDIFTEAEKDDPDFTSNYKKRIFKQHDIKDQDELMVNVIRMINEIYNYSELIEYINEDEDIKHFFKKYVCHDEWVEIFFMSHCNDLKNIWNLLTYLEYPLVKMLKFKLQYIK